MSLAPSSLRPDSATASCGLLVLVVGASGVGKDSLLDGARAAFRGRGDIVFPRRFITRAADGGGEDHIAVPETQFLQMARAGNFALHWQAHGLFYGIAREIDGELRRGHTVVANVSRAVIDQARRDYPRLRIVCVTATLEAVRQRLLGRGRESPAEIEARLRRAGEIGVAGEDVLFCSNDGSLADGIARFAGLLERISFRPAGTG